MAGKHVSINNEKQNENIEKNKINFCYDISV